MMADGLFFIDGAGLLLIGFIVWWFWLYRPGKGVRAAPGQIVEVLVKDGVYAPSRIEATAGKGISLRFVRLDETACAEQVIFPELGIQKELPLNRPVVIRVVPKEPGDYAFHCQMNMYRGCLHAE